MSDDRPKWDTPENAVSSRVNEAGELATKHGITPDRAQMLIDRFGHDPVVLETVAKRLKVHLGESSAARHVTEALKTDLEERGKEMKENVERAKRVVAGSETEGFDQPAATAEAQRILDKMDADITKDELKEE